MADISRKAHVAATAKPVPANLTFCLLHTSDFWESGTFRLKTSTTPPSTCNPTNKTFVLYLTSTEITKGLKKDDRIVIKFDDAQHGEDKLIKSYSIEPALSFALDLHMLEIDTSLRLVGEPAPEARSLWSRTCSRIQLETRIVLFKSFSWRSSVSHVSFEEAPVHATDELHEGDAPPRPAGLRQHVGANGG